SEVVRQRGSYPRGDIPARLLGGGIDVRRGRGAGGGAGCFRGPARGISGRTNPGVGGRRGGHPAGPTSIRDLAGAPLPAPAPGRTRSPWARTSGRSMVCHAARPARFSRVGTFGAGRSVTARIEPSAPVVGLRAQKGGNVLAPSENQASESGSEQPPAICSSRA